MTPGISPSIPVASAINGFGTIPTIKHPKTSPTIHTAKPPTGPNSAPVKNAAAAENEILNAVVTSMEKVFTNTITAVNTARYAIFLPEDNFTKVFVNIKKTS